LVLNKQAILKEWHKQTKESALCWTNHDATESTGASLLLNRLSSNAIERCLGKVNLDIAQAKETLILLHKRITGFCKNPDQRCFVQLVHRCHHWQAPNELWD
jgi:hypothetical protein